MCSQVCPGAKLSGCQIVHYNYLGAKLSPFIILVPNCLLYYLGAKLSGVKLSGAKLSGAKLSYNLYLCLVKNIKSLHAHISSGCLHLQLWHLEVSLLHILCFNHKDLQPVNFLYDRLGFWFILGNKWHIHYTMTNTNTEYTKADHFLEAAKKA